jgi:hypothetical protein
MPLTQLETTPLQTILSFTGSGFDATNVTSATVAEVNDDYLMYFAGLPFANNMQIGLATSSDGTDWQQIGIGPVISNSQSQAWAQFREIPVSLIYTGGEYMLWFNGDNRNLDTESGYGTGFGLATSTDGLHWTFAASNPIRFQLNDHSSEFTGVDLQEVVQFGGDFLAYYVDHSPNGDVFDVATSTDGLNFTGDHAVGLAAGYTLTAATSTVLNGETTVLAVVQDKSGHNYIATSTDGTDFSVVAETNLPIDMHVDTVTAVNGSLQFYGSVGVGNINWNYGNSDIEYATAQFGPPMAGSTPTLTSNNGVSVSIDLASVVTDPDGVSLSIAAAGLAPGSQGAGTLSLENGGDGMTIAFTPAAGFAESAVADVTFNYVGGSFVQAVDFDVVVQASSNPAAPTPQIDTVVQAEDGAATFYTTYAPGGALVGVESVIPYGDTVVSVWHDATGADVSAQIVQNLPGSETVTQNFDGSWNQLNATITTVYGNETVTQAFDPSWNLTGATITTASGGQTVVQIFSAGWHLTSAMITTVNGEQTVTQDFDGDWNQTSATVSTVYGDQTVDQNFDATWNQTSSTVVTVQGDQTITQNFDAAWNMKGGTILTVVNSGGLATKLDTYNANWTPVSEVDTATDGSQSWFVYGQAGGFETFTAATGHSTTFVLDPGQVQGDTINGLHTLNLGGSTHDVIQFDGFGADAILRPLGGSLWQISYGHGQEESFALTGGALLSTGDYLFVG